MASFRGARTGQALGQGLAGFGGALLRIAQEDRERAALEGQQEDRAFDRQAWAQSVRQQAQGQKMDERRRQESTLLNLGIEGFVPVEDGVVVPEGARQVQYGGQSYYRAPEPGFDPATDPQIQREQYFRDHGLGSYRPQPVQGVAPASGATGGRLTGLHNPNTAFRGPSIGDLPTNAQTMLTSVGPALQSLDRYEELAQDYLENNNRARRVAGSMGFADQGTVAQISAAQTAALLSMKNLAELGVLNGPDLELVENLIGSPTSATAAIRDPEATLARIGEARRFLQQKVTGIQSAYGVQQPMGEGFSAFTLGTGPALQSPAFGDEDDLEAEYQRSLGGQ